jgi:hypothetical protein
MYYTEILKKECQHQKRGRVYPCPFFAGADLFACDMKLAGNANRQQQQALSHASEAHSIFPSFS